MVTLDLASDEEALQKAEIFDVAERLGEPKGIMKASPKHLGAIGFALGALLLCLGLLVHVPGAESPETSAVDSLASLAAEVEPSEEIGFNITYLETKLKPSDVEPIVKSWVYWDPSEVKSFFNYVDGDFCNVLIHAPPAKGWDAKRGEAVFTFCGKEKFEEVVASWDRDSEKQKQQDLGDLKPPPVTVAGNTISLVEDWYGGPDVNGGKPVKETVVMVLKENGKVGNIIYSISNPEKNPLKNNSLAEEEPSENVTFDVKYLDTDLTSSEVEPIVQAWVYWNQSEAKSFFNYVDDGFCNVLINAPPAKGWNATAGEAVFTFCGREKFEEVVASWVGDSESQKQEDLGDLKPPPVIVAGKTISLVEDWYGGPDVNGGKPVKETVVMVLKENGKVGNIIYSVENPKQSKATTWACSVFVLVGVFQVHLKVHWV